MRGSVPLPEQMNAQLARYRDIKARIKVLSEYSVGAGITVSRLNADDQLQDLHKRLRNMQSYMYLSQHEQRLEATAHAYLQRYPAGTRSQLMEIPLEGVNEEDTMLLAQIRKRIEKVIDARGMHVDDLDAVLQRVAELQDLQAELKSIDNTLDALAISRPDYAKLLRLRYVDGKTPTEAAAIIGVSERTFRRWRIRAEREYEKLSG